MGAFIVVLALSGLMAGCMEKDVYDPEHGKDPLPDPSEYFDFEMRGDVKLSVNYDISGFTPLIEIYGENPVEIVEGTPVKKEGIEALFKIYTDNNGKYEGKMNIPASIDKVYLYTDTWGLPGCVELEVKDHVVNFDMSAKSSAQTKVVTHNPHGEPPYLVNQSQNLFSLCYWGFGGRPCSECMSKEETVGNESVLTLTNRMKDYFLPEGKYKDNSYLVLNRDAINISVKEEGTKLDVVFLNRDAQFYNTFGYYFYETGTSVNVNTVRKYIVFPNVSLRAKGDNNPVPVLDSGSKVRLLYFDKQGKAHDEFPKGYTVGWFIYANGFKSNDEDTLGEYLDLTTRGIFTSNPQYNNPSFVSVKDEKSGKTILGAEDGENQSYCDLLFYVNASPATSIDDTGRPTIPDDNQEETEKPDEVETITGTLAFEDIWPSGGDYDMNDVVIEYSRETYFNKENGVSKIVDTFKPVHDGASFTNAFAYQIDKEYVGKLTSLPAGAVYEEATSSIVVFPNARSVQGQTYQIVREFTKRTISKDELQQHPYNPYIIVNYVSGEKNRTEVHLPKHKATSMADQDKIGSQKDAYYINREGAYPFAIDIPVLNFVTVKEKYPIDTEYPGFSVWATSKGEKAQDWYMHHEGAK